MIIVPIKEGESIDKRQEFTKKSVIRREQLRKAIYVQQLRAAENE